MKRIRGITLTPAQRVQAAYALLMDQTRALQGEFARNAHTASNQRHIKNALEADRLAAIAETIKEVHDGGKTG